MLIERDNEYPLESFSYCLKAWREFTTMTDQEHRNYCQMMGIKQPRQDHIPIKFLCKETQEIFASIGKLAKALGVSKDTIKLAIRKGFPILGFNFVEVEE